MSNYLRAEMMKRHFMEYYNNTKSESLPEIKVIGKFGSNHVYKGHNTLNILDIGNFISEFASQNKQKSFHIYSLAAEGTVNSLNPFNRNKELHNKPFSEKESMYEFDTDFVLSLLDNKENAIIDLRPLRKIVFSGKNRLTNERLSRLVFGYDAILLLRNVKSATLYDQKKM